MKLLAGKKASGVLASSIKIALWSGRVGAFDSGGGYTVKRRWKGAVSLDSDCRSYALLGFFAIPCAKFTTDRHSGSF